MKKVNYTTGGAYSLKCFLSLPLLLLYFSTAWSLPEFFIGHDALRNLNINNLSFYTNNKDWRLQEPKNPVSRANPQTLLEDEFEEVIAKEPQLWAIAQKANTLKGYKEYLAVYPADIHSQFAQNMIQKIGAMDEVASKVLDDELKIARYDQNRLRAYQKYLNNQPTAWFLLRRNEAVQQIKSITTRIGSFNIIAEPIGGKSGEVKLEIMHGSVQSPQEFELEILQEGQILPKNQYFIEAWSQVEPHVFEVNLKGIEYGEHLIKVRHDKDVKTFSFSAPLRPAQLSLKTLAGEKYELHIKGSYGPFIIWYRTKNSENFIPQRQLKLQLRHPQQRVFVLSNANISGLRGRNKVDLQIMNADGQNLGQLHDLILNAPRSSNWILPVVLIIGLLLTASLAVWKEDMLAYLSSFPVIRVVLGAKSRSTRRRNN